MKAEVGIIGGSGLYKIEGIKEIEEIEVDTPFGKPSDRFLFCDIDGITAVFLPRHGKGHRFSPPEVPSKANIWAFKSFGVKHILAVHAVGSLHIDCKPRDFVICDQIIDRTNSRIKSFFGNGIVGHISFAEPYCRNMREKVVGVLQKHDHPHHKAGTLICMEGPQFSTRAESNLYRSWNAHVIGMTALPEAKLAREAEICLCSVAMVTDYDCWHAAEEDVTVDMVLSVMRDNSSAIKRYIPDMVKAVSTIGDCSCHSAAAGAVITNKDFFPEEIKKRLGLFYKKYWT
jgi:5'-methylthioadenosine phosphorylase